jgi:hypothetical protein
MPRGPGKKENYNLDYSRFDSFDRDEAKERDEATKKQMGQDEADAAGGMPADLPDMREMLRGMPVELQEAYHLMSIAKANGDEKAQQRASELALQAVSKGSPEVRQGFMDNISKQLPELAGKVSKDLVGADPGHTVDAKKMLAELQDEAVRAEARKRMIEAPVESNESIDTLRKQMEDGQKATRAEMENLEKKQNELENIRGPEDFMKFMKEEGITDEDLQRIFGGDEAHMQATLNETLEKQMAKGVDHRREDSADALKKAEELHTTLFGETPEPEPAAPELAVAVRKAPARPKEPEVTVPMYRLQYEKDEAGKYLSVELKCTLPGIADMSAINLDVSERHLRLSTAAAPRYAVNAGPFPVLIDPSRARAKYSKKREELSISVPVKVI